MVPSATGLCDRMVQRTDFVRKFQVSGDKGPLHLIT